MLGYELYFIFAVEVVVSNLKECLKTWNSLKTEKRRGFGQLSPITLIRHERSPHPLVARAVIAARFPIPFVPHLTIRTLASRGGCRRRDHLPPRQLSRNVEPDARAARGSRRSLVHLLLGLHRVDFVLAFVASAHQPFLRV